MPGRPFSRFALAAAAVLMLDAGTVRAELPGDPDPTFKTTLPPPSCTAAPSLDGTRCRLAALTGALDAATGPGKLEKKLLGAASGAETQLGTGQGAAKEAQEGAGRIRRIGNLLASKKAEREIGAEARATLAAEADALATEVEALIAAGS